MRDRTFAVYILSNQFDTVLYTGVTNDIIRRVAEHKEHKIPGFTSQYRVNKLVYYEYFGEPALAIAREKQIKAGSRKKKKALINGMNPEWKDLFQEIKS
jgi:putative endonuclease